MIDPVLARAEAPYVVVIGPPALTRRSRPAAAERFTVLGEIFAPGEVDLGRDEAASAVCAAATRRSATCIRRCC